MKLWAEFEVYDKKQFIRFLLIVALIIGGTVGLLCWAL